MVDSASQAALAIPVTLRALAPSGPTTFSGLLTGGNGRASFTGVTEYYQFNLPAGDPEINGSVTLANNPDNQLSVWLIDPSGQAQAFQSNGLVTEDSSGNLSLHQRPGRQRARARARRRPVDDHRHLRPDRIGNSSQRAVHGVARPDPGRR